MTSTTQPRIDASVQVFFKSDSDLRTYLQEPFTSRGFAEPDVSFYAPPGPRYATGHDTAGWLPPRLGSRN